MGAISKAARKFSVMALILGSCVLSSFGQSKAKVLAVHFEGKGRLPIEIKFFCAETYPTTRCKEHALILRSVLEQYPIQSLAPWSFILVPNGEWEPLVHLANGAAGSPAFTSLQSRETFMSESLFGPSRLQLAAQMQLFGMDGIDLLEFAVSHELGHALCRKRDESQAELCARELRDGRRKVGVEKRTPDDSLASGAYTP